MSWVRLKYLIFSFCKLLVKSSLFLNRELTELPLVQIGSQIGGSDHSTIIHGCKSIEKMIKNDVNLSKNINRSKS